MLNDHWCLLTSYGNNFIKVFICQMCSYKVQSFQSVFHQIISRLFIRLLFLLCDQAWHMLGQLSTTEL